eukprot:161559-Rhodomonas_salina.2
MLDEEETGERRDKEEEEEEDESSISMTEACFRLSVSARVLTCVGVGVGVGVGIGACVGFFVRVRVRVIMTMLVMAEWDTRQCAARMAENQRRKEEKQRLIEAARTDELARIELPDFVNDAELTESLKGDGDGVEGEIRAPGSQAPPVFVFQCPPKLVRTWASEVVRKKQACDEGLTAQGKRRLEGCSHVGAGGVWKRKPEGS